VAKIKWTEKKIAQMVAEGLGKGKLADYKPWIHVRDFSSRGRARRIWSVKTGRVHQLLSDVEYQVFIALEWQSNIVDIREQFPLDRALTQDIARSLGIVHPCYPGTTVPTVMTADFVATVVKDGETTSIVFNAKTAAEVEDQRAVEKLEIQREYFHQLGFEHHLIFDCDLPPSNMANIGEIREAPLRPDELEPRPGYFDDLCQRMVNDMPAASQQMSLLKYCIQFDERFGCPPATGIRVAKILMARRILVPDLSSPKLEQEPLSKFVLMSKIVPLRAVGGA